MPSRPLLVLAVAASLLAGCANFSSTEIAQIRQRGVPAGIVGKMESGHILTPPEIVELTRRGVPERIVLRQIDNTGLDYTLSNEDFARLRKAGVSQPVLDALTAESERFARGYVTGFGPHYVSPYDDTIYGPDPYRYTGDATAGVGFSSYQGPRTYDPYVWRR